MRHVAILIEISRIYVRGLLRGIARYHRECGSRSTVFQPQGLGDPPPPWLATWRGDGVLARIDNHRLTHAIEKANVPVVNLRGKVTGLTFPFIDSDNRAIAKMAADHLFERGLRHFTFYGFRGGFHANIDELAASFRQFIERAGGTFDALSDTARRRRIWEQEQAWIGRWIAGLSKPVGVSAANNDRGLQVLDACRRDGIAVPDQVAVLGVDNDEYRCSLSLAPLSSIDLNSEETGYRAAALLDEMMVGKRPPKRLPEYSAACRQSTGCLPPGPHPQSIYWTGSNVARRLGSRVTGMVLGSMKFHVANHDV